MKISEIKDFLTTSLANKDNFVHSNEIAKRELSTSVEELTQILHSPRPEIIATAITRFLQNRWHRIQSTPLAYPSSSDSPMTQLCLQLAKMISANVGKTPYQLMMPTVTQKENLAGTTWDEIPLNHFVLSDDNTWFFTLPDIFDSAAEDGVLKDFVDGKVVNLSEAEIERVTDHPKAYDLYNAYLNRFYLTTATMSTGSALKTLANTLVKAGSKKGNGEEYSAGSGAYEAVIEFDTWFKKLSKKEQKFVLSLTAKNINKGHDLQRGNNVEEDNVKSFNDILERLRHTKQFDMAKEEWRLALIEAFNKNKSVISKLGINVDFSKLSEQSALNTLNKIKLKNKNLYLEIRRIADEKCELALNMSDAIYCIDWLAEKIKRILTSNTNLNTHFPMAYRESTASVVSVAELDKKCEDAKKALGEALESNNFKSNTAYSITDFDRITAIFYAKEVKEIKFPQFIEEVKALSEKSPLFFRVLFSELKDKLMLTLNELMQTYDPVNHIHPLAQLLEVIPLNARMDVLGVIGIDSITHCDDLRHVIAQQSAKHTAKVVDLFDSNPQKLMRLVKSKSDLTKLLEVMHCGGDIGLHNTNDMKKIIKFIDDNLKHKISTTMYKQFMLIITGIYRDTCQQRLFSRRSKEDKIKGANALLCANFTLFTPSALHKKGTLKMLVTRLIAVTA